MAKKNTIAIADKVIQSDLGIQPFPRLILGKTKQVEAVSLSRNAKIVAAYSE